VPPAIFGPLARPAQHKADGNKTAMILFMPCSFGAPLIPRRHADYAPFRSNREYLLGRLATVWAGLGIGFARRLSVLASPQPTEEILE
jgi:hypothetical protein